jgi:flagellar hook-associated protein 2
VAVESRPIAQLQTAATKLNTQVSALGKMQSLMAALQDAANTLTSNALWTRSVATSSNEAVVGTVGGSNAAAGNYGVTVQGLAAPQTLASGSIFGAPTDVVGGGTLTIELGSWDDPPSTFTARSGAAAVSITVTAEDTLQTLRDKVNAAGAGVGASIVTDASGSRLALRSSASGVENGFRVTVADDDGNGTDTAGLSRLAFDPAAGANGMIYSQKATNAQATINGIAVTTTSNDLGGVIDGLTLRLRQRSDEAVDVNVASDREAVKDAIKKFADAFNELARYIAEQTKYDPASKVGGPLQGDSAVGGLLGRLRGLVNGTTGASTVFTRLSDIGLQMQRDGTLKLDGAKVDSAVANLAELKKALSTSDADVPGNNGLARQFASLATQVLGVDGALTTRTDGLRTLISKNQEQQQRYEDRVERYRERLVAQFSAMDANLSRLNALQSYVTQQLAALQKSKDN